MRIALDLTPLAGRFPPSVVRTVHPVMDALRRMEGVELVELMPTTRSDLSRLRLPLWRQRVLPRLAHEAGAEVLHVFASAFPLRSRVPVVQTVHELPWKRGAHENAGLRHRAWVRLGRRRARATCVPSERVAEDLGGGPHVRVVPWGVGQEFLRPVDTAELWRAHPALPSGAFVLAPGAARPKKRLDRIVRGAQLAGLPVVVTGRGPLPVDAPGVHALGHVEDARMPALFDAAAAVCLLADSEGFALPVLEAFARGTAVAVPSGSVQASTAGGLATGVDADDPVRVGEALARAAEQAGDPAFAQPRIDFARGRTWDRTAERLLSVWGDVRA